METAYVELVAYHSSVRGSFATVMADLRAAEDEASRQLLARTEAAILSFEGNRAGYQTAHLGNALRAAALAVEREFRQQARGHITPLQDGLDSLLSATDAQILKRSRDTSR